MTAAPQFLASTVTAKTALPSRYRENAAWQSMDVYLNDWIKARDRLDRQIAELRVLQLRRHAEVERGEWPPGGGAVSAPPIRWEPPPPPDNLPRHLPEDEWPPGFEEWKTR